VSIFGTPAPLFSVTYDKRAGFDQPRQRSEGAPENRKNSMAGLDNWKKTVRRNKLLGMWAAEKLGITGRDAEAYSDALAVGTLDPERSDVLSKIRKDFDAAGVVQSDEQILSVMNELILQAGSQAPGTPGGATDALAVMLAQKIKSQ
jgi:hypothetical protein